VDEVHCDRPSSVYCGFPVSQSTSAPYSFTDLTPMLTYKRTYKLIKRQRRYKNHVTIWRLICHANSFSCHGFVINALYCFCKDSKRHGVALQSESIAELFSLRPAPREPWPLALLVPASAKEWPSQQTSASVNTVGAFAPLQFLDYKCANFSKNT